MKSMLFLKYITEIRNRIIVVILSFILTLIVTFLYKETLLYITVQPSFFLIKKNSFYFISTNLIEVFSTYIKFNFFISVYITLIPIFCHITLYFLPIFTSHEYQKLKLTFYTLLVVWISSFYLNYYFLIPQSWKFFLSFQTLETTKNSSNLLNLYFEAKISEYVDFFIEIQLICYIFCSFIVLLLHIFTLICVKKLRKHIYFSFFILSAFISPPEVITQLLTTIFICFIFEFFFIKYLMKTKYF